MKSNKPISRKSDLVTQEANGEIMVFDLNTNKAFCLNETSSLVWAMCDGNKTVSEISEGLSKKFKAPASEDLVWLAIDQLKKDNLIANSEELENNTFDGISRREVIKKVGLGTMIALPLVTGLIAPKAANAASGLVCTQGAVTENGVFSQGQDGYCRCQSAGAVQGQFCTADPSTSQVCKSGCQCRSTATGSVNGTCQ